MRIHVWLAKHSTLSRRKAEELVKAGSVMIDGKPSMVGQSVAGTEVIAVDSKVIRAATVDRQLIALHKPVGYVCSQNPQERQVSVYELLPKLTCGKWILVGRLDVNTSGLLLITTDGQLANQLAHPSSGFVREYLARVSASLSDKMLISLKEGVMLEDGKASFKSIKPHGRSSKGINTWYSVSLTEGRNRIVRRLFESLGTRVSRLVRVRFGPIRLDKALGVGKYQVIDCGWIDKYLSK